MPSTNRTPLWRKYLTVEPVVFFYFFGFLMSFPVVRLYIYERVSDMKGFPYKNVSQEGAEGGCGGEGLENNSTLNELEKEVQAFASQLDVGLNLVMSIPSLIVAPFWGPWTDQGGKRKPAMLVAIFGAGAELVILLLAMYFNWSLYVLFLAGAVNGLSGFVVVFMIGTKSYLADISTAGELAFRIAVLYSAIFFAGVTSQLTSGLWIDNVGFIPSVWFLLACFVMAGIWAFFFVPEATKTTTDGERKPHFFSLKSLKGVIDVFRKRPDDGRKNLVLLMLSSGICFLSGIGIDGVKMLFILKSPLCLPPTMVGYFYASEMFLQGVGSVVGIKLLAYCFRDLSIARIGMSSLMSASILLAFSDRTWMVFLVGAAAVLSAVGEPILVGGMSRIAGANEQGALFSAYGIVTAVTQLVGAILFNTVYQATLGLSFKGWVFIFCALLVLIPFGLVGFIELPPIAEKTARDDKKLPDNGELKTDSKEQKAIETSF